MQITQPNASLWLQPSDWQLHVQRAAILCYGRKQARNAPASTLSFLIKHGHLSMFRHATHYYVFEQQSPFRAVVDREFIRMVAGSEYCGYYHSPRFAITETMAPLSDKTDRNHVTGTYFMVINGQYLLDRPDLENELVQHEVSLDQYVIYAMRMSDNPKTDILADTPTGPLSLIRLSVFASTQISTTREMNRVSPNNIAEQSTRYVDFEIRDGGITICQPHWWDDASWARRAMARIGWKCCEWSYRLARRFGMNPEDAREFLPLCTQSRVLYTYNLREWKHIFDLRLFGKTGKPHPNAQVIASLIHRELYRFINTIAK